MGDNMRDSTSRLHHNTHDHMHNMGQRARHSEGQASDFIQEHPLVVGALGFALGAALGAVFPATKKRMNTWASIVIALFIRPLKAGKSK
ncbi:hypothetical protein HSBAA_11310 [Vreelandella sulfidaeris]|uniref:Uncharacterized protein n=1 Tax=Vreelandella sulfidaeris TaxID=115553 RepID=A0A455U1Y0_9GAMM|nr:hypothetical protein HSBAA_11310 [Halomonas sulfidaeris]